MIHLPAYGTPGALANCYWSLLLVETLDYRVVPNALNRFNLSSSSPLVTEPDGSVKIGVGPTPVAGVAESNWLPAPRGRPFLLSFRILYPGRKTCNGPRPWQPP